MHLGQNFLIDERVAQKEVEYARLEKDDVVLEIGPGKGILTRLLAERAKKVIAIEIDANLIYELKPTLPKNVVLIEGDALKIDFKSLRFNKVVSNLPFQISSPITFKLLEYPFSRAILIYQKDFAERMVAAPNSRDYSRLSVGVYYKSLCSILETVPKRCFSPKPKVDSSIVEIIPRKKPPFRVVNEEFFFDLTKKLFSHRRKKVKNTLKGMYDKEVPYGNMRVGEMTPEQIGELSNFLCESLHSVKMTG